jgi:hypothetical protein
MLSDFFVTLSHTLLACTEMSEMCPSRPRFWLPELHTPMAILMFRRRMVEGRLLLTQFELVSRKL